MTDVIAAVTQTLRLEAQAIEACAHRIESDPKQSQSFVRAIDIFRKALDAGGKIAIVGLGKSGKVAQKIAATLSSTGSPSIHLHPTEALHGDIGLLSSSDAVLAMSYTGNTEELVRLVPSLKSLRIPVVGCGGNAESQLAQRCDVWLDAAVAHEACPNNLAPTTSTTLAMAIGDAIAVTLMKVRGFDAQAFARNHPGGALGRRLSYRVADLMHSGDAVPTVLATASMDEVVVSSSRGKLGAVLVVEGRKLLGIITDGDIRRALAHREKFFRMTASDVMTRSPVSASPELAAQKALDLMENRPSQIAVLPVVTDQGEWIGLLRLHDLVRSL